MIIESLRSFILMREDFFLWLYVFVFFKAGLSKEWLSDEKEFIYFAKLAPLSLELFKDAFIELELPDSFLIANLFGENMLV